MQSGKRLILKDYFAKHTRTHKNHKNTNVELLWGAKPDKIKMVRDIKYISNLAL
jgi:hypothetical protein